MSPAAGREALRKRWPDEFRDAARCAFLRRFDHDRERGGYPKGFHGWEIERRNSWFAGFNVGFHDRFRLAQEEGGDGAA